MRQFINDYIRKNFLITPDDLILIAISGGLDSLVLFHLLKESGYHTALAHCNFGLRGNESEADEAFIRELAKKYRVPVFVKRFDTAGYAKKKGISIQMAARELRYNWFEEIRKNEGYDWIATAHHLDDQIETFFINLLRGTGISGLGGIMPRNGKIIRPILFATRKEILAYAKQHKLSFREDSSNTSKKYLRNRIRLDLIPLIEEIQPEFQSIMADNIRRLKETNDIFLASMAGIRKKLIRKSKDGDQVNASELRDVSLTFLYELLSPYGINEAVCGDLMKSLSETEAKLFQSEGYELRLERGMVFITQRAQRKKEGRKEKVYQIRKGQREMRIPIHLSLREVNKEKESDVPLDRRFASLDKDKLQFPLLLRRWKPGDVFHPFGMRGKKKLSDFFIDRKMTTREKEDTWLLISGGAIAWVIGHRIDHRFRVTGKTRAILRISVGVVI
ncbi:MAG: tRNA lysidine(34) synthetase TilS [Bacteroidetes bacterium]|nr:tRNA lysidine(34) synthetase TilS [Bacteroidota bacterium]